MLLALAGAIQIAVFLVLLNAVGHNTPSSSGLYFDYASRMLAGDLPYRDFAVEYPPLALIFFLLPRLATATSATYAMAFAVETLLFGLVGLTLVVLSSLRLNIPPWKSAAAYTVFVLMVGPLSAGKYDIFPAVIVLLALHAALSDRNKAAGAWLAAGAMTKLYPAFLLPVLIAHFWRNRCVACVKSAVLAFAATAGLIAIPFLLASPGGLLGSITYHAVRGVQLESTYSTLLILGDKLGLLSVEPHVSFGSWNLTGTTADVVAYLSVLILGLALVATYRSMYRRIHSGSYTARELLTYSALVITVVLAASKVLSPEYLIWLVPLVPLLSGTFSRLAWIVFAAIVLLTYSVFTLLYVQLIWFQTAAVLVLLLRNVLIVGLAALAAASMHR